MKGIYSLEKMYNVGNGDELGVEFDFSTIPNADYFNFFKALPNFIYKKCDSIKFSTKARIDYESSVEKNRNQHEIIQNSLFSNNRKYTSYLLKILSRTVLKSKTLRALTFQDLIFREKYFKMFTDTVGKSQQLIELYFINISLTKDELINLLNSISPFQLSHLWLVHCGLNSDSISIVLDFLTKPPKNSLKVWKLIELNLSENEFSEEDAIKIKDILMAEGNSLGPKFIANNLQIHLEQEKNNEQEFYEEEEEVFLEEEDFNEVDIDYINQSFKREEEKQKGNNRNTKNPSLTSNTISLNYDSDSELRDQYHDVKDFEITSETDISVSENV